MNERGVGEHEKALLIGGILTNKARERKCGHSCALKSRFSHGLIGNSKVIFNLRMTQNTPVVRKKNTSVL